MIDYDGGVYKRMEERVLSIIEEGTHPRAYEFGRKLKKAEYEFERCDPSNHDEVLRRSRVYTDLIREANKIF
jgi:hypothetical protein